MMISAAREGLTVIRLKIGDPLVFGRAAEEMDALDAAGLPYEIVPGITAAFAAAAQLGRSLTDRRSASSILFSTGHRAEQTGPREQIAQDSPTRVVYMPGRSFAAIADEWIATGEPPALPCVVISCAARPDQTVQHTTLAELARIVPGPAPVLLLAGAALAQTSVADFSSMTVEANLFSCSSEPDSPSLPSEMLDAD